MWNLFHYRPILHGENIFDHIENYFPLASSGFTYGTGLNTCSPHLAAVKSIAVLKCSESGFISGFFEGLYARMFCIAFMILSVILWTRFEWYPYWSWPMHSLMYLRTHFWKPVRIWIWVLRENEIKSYWQISGADYLFLPVWVRAQCLEKVSQQQWHVLLVLIEFRNHQKDRIRLRLIVFFFCSGILSIHLKII